MSPSSATAARRSPSPWITGSRRTGPSRSPSSIPCTCSPWRTRPRLTRPSSGSSSPRARRTPAGGGHRQGRVPAGRPRPHARAVHVRGHGRAPQRGGRRVQVLVHHRAREAGRVLAVLHQLRAEHCRELQPRGGAVQPHVRRGEGLPLRGRETLAHAVLDFFLRVRPVGAFWALTLYNSKNSQPGSVQQIHLLMGVLVFFKCLTVLCQSGMYHLIRLKGDPEGWNVAFYIFYSIRGLLLFTVVVLIGTGWSFLKPFLNDREKQVLMIVIPLQVFANIAVVILDENGPALNGWLEWRDLFHLLDIICCCAILFPIVWSIKHLREAAMTDGKKIRNMNKLILFRQFYVMVVAYIYFTRIIVFSPQVHRRVQPDVALELRRGGRDAGVLLRHRLDVPPHRG